MVAVEIGLLPWLSPSVSGLPPSPPPKKQNITQRLPCSRHPASESALMVANGLPLARSGAFAKAAPERANGSPFATINALSLAGWREHGRRWVMFCFFGGGLGGNPETDGLNHGNNPISTATIPPLEILESLYPVMFTQWALRPDSGGPGKHRGGLGAIYEIEALADGGAEVFLLGQRGFELGDVGRDRPQAART